MVIKVMSNISHLLYVLRFYHFLRKKAIIFSVFGGRVIQGGDHLKKKDKEEVIIVDPFGSYTGLVNNKDEKPVQDADDL